MPIRANSKLRIDADILNDAATMEVAPGVTMQLNYANEAAIKKAVKVQSSMFGEVSLDEWISSVEEFLLREGDGSVY